MSFYFGMRIPDLFWIKRAYFFFGGGLSALGTDEQLPFHRGILS